MSENKGLNDKELISAANLGERAAMEEIYQRYKGWVYNFAYHLCGNEEDASDALQEVFIYLFKKFPGFELRCQLKTFLFPVVRNISLEQIRKRRRGKNLSLEDVADQLPAKEEIDENRQRQDLAEVVSSLSEEHSEMVIMRFGDDLSLAEISRELQIPLGTVKSRLHNALSKLRNMLQK